MRGSYGKKRKANGGDRYGTYSNGVQTSPETIAGRTISKQLPSLSSRDQRS